MSFTPARRDRRQIVDSDDDMRSEMETMHKVLFRAAHVEPVGAATPFPLPRLARRAASPAPREVERQARRERRGGLMSRVLFRVALAEERDDGAPSTSTPDAMTEMTEMTSETTSGIPEMDSPSGGGTSSDTPEKQAPKKPKTYKKVEMPTPEQMMMDDTMNNCVVKTVLATVMGSVLGAAMGIFFGAFEPSMPGDEKLSIAQSLKNAGKSSLQKAASYAKGFAVFGALYSGSECVVEQTRAKHDIYNSACAGCFTGGVMARSGGPQGMAIGCGTMAALSVAMDHFMDIH
jgi:import inner membrane translocase subunit TIM22